MNLRTTLVLRLLQVSLAGSFFLLWQFLPKIDWLSERYKFLDPLFISSPTSVFSTLWDMMTGTGGREPIWPYVWTTVSTAGMGLIIGLSLGGAFGLMLSNSVFLTRLFEPFVVAANAIPRIALIPIVVIIVGPTARASVIISVLVVFFVAFYNALEGGRTVNATLVQSAVIMGAKPSQIAYRIRYPYALAWTIASLPLATTFALLSVVTGEILTGYGGLGKLITASTISGDAALTFVVVIVLSIVGVLVASGATLVRKRVLHWWDSAAAW